MKPVSSAINALKSSVALSCLGCALLAQAAESHNGKVVKVDTAENRITIAAVMGHKSLRVLKPELLSQVKVGDQIKFTMGQDGTEAVVTGIEVNKQ